MDSQHEAREVGWSLDNDVERGYERQLIEGVTVKNMIPDLEVAMLDMAALTQAVA